MANFNGLPNASVEYLPNLGSTEIPLIKTNHVENSSDSDSALVGIVENSRNRAENLQDFNSTTSNVTSFDDILRDIIETSKNHMINQIQQQPMVQPIDHTIPSFYPPGNFYQNFANFSGGFPNFCPSFSQSMNFCSPNYNSMNIASTNNNSYDNYETLIETIYEDANENENLSREMNESSILENNVNNNHTVNINSINSIPRNDQSEQHEVNNQVLHSEKELILPPLHTQISNPKSQSSLQYVSQPLQQQSLSNSLDIPILSSANMAPISSQQLKYNANDTKIFCPKILSLDNRTIFNQVNSTALTPRTYSNTMPPPFSISNTSAFNSYRKRGQKRVFPNEYINLNKTPTIQQTESNNQDTIVFQIKQEPCNVFIVNEETISSGQPEWLVEKSYVTSDMICVRPPMQTKRTVERAKEVAINDLFAIDFSSLDTSNIVIPTIQIKGPLHKKRKQDLKSLKSLENSNLDETIYIDDINNNTIQPFDIKITSNSDEKENSEKSDLPNKVKNKLINNSDTDDEVETHLQSILSPLDQISDTKANNTNDKSTTEDEICESKSEEKFLPISEGGCFNEDDVSEVGSLEEEILQVKSLKCDVCNKIFKSRNTLTRHKKKCHSSLTIKKDKKESSNDVINNSLKEETLPPIITTKSKEDEKLKPQPSVEMKHDVEEKVQVENNSTNKNFESQEKLKKDIKKNEQKSFTSHTNIKKQTIEKQRTERKVMKRRKSTSIAIEDAENDKMKSNDEKRKRRTRSNIVSYKE